MYAENPSGYNHASQFFKDFNRFQSEHIFMLRYKKVFFFLECKDFISFIYCNKVNAMNLECILLGNYLKRSLSLHLDIHNDATHVFMN